MVLRLGSQKAAGKSSASCGGAQGGGLGRPQVGQEWRGYRGLTHCPALPRSCNPGAGEESSGPGLPAPAAHLVEHAKPKALDRVHLALGQGGGEAQQAGTLEHAQGHRDQGHVRWSAHGAGQGGWHVIQALQSDARR